MTTDQMMRTYSFFEEIGIRVEKVGELTSACCPGLSSDKGVIKLMEENLEYPGDLFYVAGRIAVQDGAERPDLDDSLRLEPASEMAAMAWAYAASQFLEVEPEVVFHSGGYHGQSYDLINAYSSGQGPGAPMLQYWGMTESFPSMNHWLRN